MAGSSFSNRYQRDEYRVADALAAATGKEVDNYSLAGGGLAGAIESYVLSGEIDVGGHDVVVWELPYTESFKSISGLRQLLGALQSRRSGKEISRQPLAASGTTEIALRASNDGDLLLAIDTGGIKAQRMHGTIRFDNGSKAKFTANRNGRVPVNRRSREIFVSLATFSGRRPIAITLNHETTKVQEPQLTIRRFDNPKRVEKSQ